jgi:hypothetical protein
MVTTRNLEGLVLKSAGNGGCTVQAMIEHALASAIDRADLLRSAPIRRLSDCIEVQVVPAIERVECSVPKRFP